MTDGVVRLRPFAESDAAALARIWRDPAIRARNTIPEPSEEAALAWIERTAAATVAGEAWEWAIDDVAASALAGRRGLKEIDWAQRRATAACWVAPAWRGRGFSGRSLRLAAAHAFEHGVVRIEGACELDNTAAQRGMLKAGMHFEGIDRGAAVSNAGRRVDMLAFCMEAKDLV